MSKPKTCAIKGCNTRISLSVLMCFPHWQLVSPKTQKLLYATYRTRQKSDGRRQWLDAIKQAIAEVTGDPA